MQTIYSGSNFQIASSFGKFAQEGTLVGKTQGQGQAVSFSVSQINPVFNSVWIEITPITGYYSDFWDTYSNRIGGEPAGEGDISGFVNASGGLITFYLNADTYNDPKIAKFAVSIYESPVDAAFGYSPLASTTFGIIDDDWKQFGSLNGPVVDNFASGAGGWTSQDLYPRHVADVNGDGYGDIVGFGHAGTFISFGSESGSFTAPVLATANFGRTTGWTSDNLYHRELVDVNGDGHADIIGFGYSGTYVSLAQENGSFTEAAVGVENFGQTTGWASQESFARTTGDVNGDGAADIIGFGVAGTYVSLGKGDGTFQDAALATANFGANQGWTSDDRFHRTAADVNGDGFDDLIGFGVAGTWVALSNGSGGFGETRLAVDSFGQNQGWTGQDAFAREVAHVNEDDFADIVGFGAAGTYIAYGQADGSFSSPVLDVAGFGANQGWTSDNSYHRELVDLNNDGLNDVVGFGQLGVFASYNQGDYFI